MTSHQSHLWRIGGISIFPDSERGIGFALVGAICVAGAMCAPTIEMTWVLFGLGAGSLLWATLVDRQPPAHP